MPKCKAAHTAYQPSEEEWFCPECRRKRSGSASRIEFTVFKYAVDSDPDCGLLHEYDEIHCIDCGYTTCGTTLAREKQEASKKIECPHCKGTGRW